MNFAERKRALEAQLAELREETPEVKAAREAREMADLEALVAASEKHGARRVRAVETAEGDIIIKRPNHMHYRRFVDAEDAKSDELERLVRSCIVYPSADQVDRIFEELPATLNVVASAIVQMAGHRAENVAGK